MIIDCINISHFSFIKRGLFWKNINLHFAKIPIENCTFQFLIIEVVNICYFFVRKEYFLTYLKCLFCFQFKNQNDCYDKKFQVLHLFDRRKYFFNSCLCSKYYHKR